MKRSVSVIVPVYNVEQYLSKCLDSLVSQSVKFDEIILVNDGSTDGSGEICKEFADKYSNIILLEQSNQGQAVARNRGLEIADGEYIVFADADDFVMYDLNQHVQENLEPDLDMLYYRADFLNELGAGYDRFCLRDHYSFGTGVISGIEYFQKRFWNNYNVVVYLYAFRRDFLMSKGILFPQGVFYEDNVFFVRAVLNAKRIKCIPDYLYIRRYRPDSTMTGRLTVKKGVDYIDVQQMLWEELNLYPEKEAYKDFFKCFLTNSVMLPFSFLRTVEENYVIKAELQRMVTRFAEQWLWIYEETELDWNDIYMLQFLLNCIGREGGRCIKTIDNILKKELTGRMKRMGLNDAGKKIGIYGMGKHTEQLLKLSKKYAGEVRCELFFVVTDKNVYFYEGKPVYDCSEIPKDADSIIISSAVYGKEMRKELQKNNIASEKIIELYGRKDKRDITQMKFL